MEIAIMNFVSVALLVLLIRIAWKQAKHSTPKVGMFQKITYEQFKKDYDDYIDSTEGQPPANTNIIYEGIQLPTRATKGSAGYDFYSPVAFMLHAGESINFPTGIRSYIEDGWVLKMYPRSSLGFKHQTGLANTVGIIDSDYYYSDNNGHIWVKLVNNGDKDLVVKRGDRVVQGIFEAYGITYGDKVEAQRVGGFGSSGR